MAKLQTMARIDADLKAMAENAAAKENRSVSNLMETALRLYLIEKGYMDKDKDGIAQHENPASRA